MKNEMLYLNHMLERCEKVRKIVSSMTKEEFCQDSDSQDLVVHSFEIIERASNNLPAEFKEKYSEIPWVEIKDFRNILIHQYFRIDPEEVWTIAHTDLDDLYSFLMRLCKPGC